MKKFLLFLLFLLNSFGVRAGESGVDALFILASEAFKLSSVGAGADEGSVVNLDESILPSNDVFHGLNTVVEKSQEKRAEDSRFYCDYEGCGKSFSQNYNLNRHKRTCKYGPGAGGARTATKRPGDSAGSRAKRSKLSK